MPTFRIRTDPDVPCSEEDDLNGRTTDRVLAALQTIRREAIRIKPTYQRQPGDGMTHEATVRAIRKAIS